MAVDERKIDEIWVKLKTPDPKAAPWSEYHFPFTLVWSFYNVCMRSGGPEDAWRLALLGASLDRALSYEGNEQDVYGDVPASIDTQLAGVMGSLWNSLKQDYPTPDELLLKTSYDQLRKGFFSRAEAAAFASQMLGRHIEAEAWRKRVDAYADRQHWPRLGLRRGRPKNRKNKSENSG